MSGYVFCKRLSADNGSCKQSHVHESFLVEVGLEYSAVFHNEFAKLLNGGLGVAIDLHRASCWSQRITENQHSHK